jgi:undecaprenyl-diphosphatase
MPEWVVAILLGMIEGITEFLPVSSTGHLLIAQHWLPRQSDLFNIVIQTGAVLAVLVVFQGRLRQLAKSGRDPASAAYVKKIVFAFVLTCFGGLVLDKSGLKLPENMAPVAWATLVGGLLFLLVEKRTGGGSATRPDADTQISWTIAGVIAAAQLLAAIFPGASRSGTTILVALLLGLSRPAAVEFSFLLGVPTLLAAGGWKIFKAFRHADSLATENWMLLALATATAALTAFVVVRWLLRFIQTHTFTVFGWYRVVLGLLLLVGSSEKIGQMAPRPFQPVPAIGKNKPFVHKLFTTRAAAAAAITGRPS